VWTGNEVKNIGSTVVLTAERSQKREREECITSDFGLDYAFFASRFARRRAE